MTLLSPVSPRFGTVVLATQVRMTGSIAPVAAMVPGTQSVRVIKDGDGAVMLERTLGKSPVVVDLKRILRDYQPETLKKGQKQIKAQQKLESLQPLQDLSESLSTKNREMDPQQLVQLANLVDKLLPLNHPERLKLGWSQTLDDKGNPTKENPFALLLVPYVSGLATPLQDRVSPPTVMDDKRSRSFDQFTFG